MTQQAGAVAKRGNDSAQAWVAAYVVLSHTAGAQLDRLVRAILVSSPQAHVFVCHDARTCDPPVAHDERVHVRAHGLATDWGSWELVQAALEGFAWAREVLDPDLSVLISGADYPARPLAAWEAEIRERGGGWVGGDVHELRYRPHWGTRLGEGDDDLTRYTYRWVRVPWTGQRSTRVIQAVTLRLEPVMDFRVLARGRGAYLGFRRAPDPFPPGRPCVKASQWVALDRPLMAGLLINTAPGTPARRLFRRSVIPDEAMVPTLLWWTQPPTAGRVTYDRWATRDTIEGLDLRHLGQVVSSGAAFCRKVEATISEALLDALDLVNGVGSGRAMGEEPPDSLAGGSKRGP